MESVYFSKFGVSCKKGENLCKLIVWRETREWTFEMASPLEQNPGYAHVKLCWSMASLSQTFLRSVGTCKDHIQVINLLWIPVEIHYWARHIPRKSFLNCEKVMQMKGRILLFRQQSVIDFPKNLCWRFPQNAQKGFTKIWKTSSGGFKGFYKKSAKILLATNFPKMFLSSFQEYGGCGKDLNKLAI